MEDNIIYQISIDDLQYEAMEALGRELTEEEIDIAKDAFEWGLGETNHIIYNTIFTEMIK
ncbi:hypothetical protein AGMMS50239_33460 [Bacteroidia bacterium]|nr:hypothetical protein AGMMS50239_33460 [Bacteroidia bacterium]GHV32195.1 hypothetical protein FACS1894177_08000 [Bacteroidia bacterium]